VHGGVLSQAKMVEQESRKKRMSKEHKIQSMIEEEEMHELKELNSSDY